MEYFHCVLDDVLEKNPEEWDMMFVSTCAAWWWLPYLLSVYKAFRIRSTLSSNWSMSLLISCTCSIPSIILRVLAVVIYWCQGIRVLLWKEWQYKFLMGACKKILMDAWWCKKIFLFLFILRESRDLVFDCKHLKMWTSKINIGEKWSLISFNKRNKYNVWK